MTHSRYRLCGRLEFMVRNVLQYLVYCAVGNIQDGLYQESFTMYPVDHFIL